MKKLLITLLNGCFLATLVVAYSPLEGSDTRGDKKFCYYMYGSVVVI